MIIIHLLIQDQSFLTNKENAKPEVLDANIFHDNKIKRHENIFIRKICKYKEGSQQRIKKLIIVNLKRYEILNTVFIFTQRI